MKDWQKGYELDYLKSVAKVYEPYNSYTLSPFAEMKKNNVAELLSKGTLKNIGEDTYLDVAISRVSSPITMYGKTVIANKTKGDITFSKLVGKHELLIEHINSYTDDAWLYVWAEDTQSQLLAEECGFCLVGPKITTYGELHNIYYRGKPREFPKVDLAEYASIKKLSNCNESLIDKISEKLHNLPNFTNHYSNYNKGKSWSAISLRGYSSDPSFITKPIEMSDKWNKEHEGEEFYLQDTSLYEHFPEVRELIKPFGDKVHRVRFMALSPGGGELDRHTDQVDPDSGGTIGKLARIHFPIVTNDSVIFTVWHTDASKKIVNMKKGEVWFLDTRKPHQAINGGTENRIHLVVDIETEENLHELIVA